ncbi:MULTISPECIES: hypothetical protein [Niastella]|uniref:DUF1640 domain-containing protein n=1 Tax=Niastella soli TaxID=2821487 RepID=A0ABS3YWJ8_9BACT|nr:hypothetical protein [Niastella soli]MBO9202311.1 hypothetical protein [Niastella soli]
MVTASQTLKIYELFNKHFKNGEDANVLVQEIEGMIDCKFEVERDRLATKSDLHNAVNEVRKDVNEVKKEMNEVKKEINRVEVRMEQGFKEQLKWIIGMMMGLAGLLVTIIFKLK